MYFGILLLAVVGGERRLAVSRRGGPTSSPGRCRRMSRPSAASRLVTVRVGVRTALPTAARALARHDCRRASPAKREGVFPALGSGLRGGERVVELVVHGHAACGAASTPIGPLTVTSTDPFGLARRSDARSASARR